MPLRILQVLPSLEMGGVEENTIHDAIIFKENGIVPFVASSGGKMKKRLDVECIQHFYMPLNWKNPLMLLINSLWFIVLIYLKEIDIIHARSRAPAWSACFACKLTGCKFITTFHGYYSGFDNPIKKHYNKIMTYGEKVIVSNDFMKNHIEQHYKCPSEKIVVMPRGVDVEKFQNVEQSRIESVYEKYGCRNIILVPGRITDWKGQHIFLEAFREFQKDSKEYVGILMGKAKKESQYFKRIERFIKVYNLNVIIEEECHDVPALFKASQCVVLPTLKYETFGRCGVEALAANKPIIATKYNISLPEVSFSEYHPFSPLDLENCLRKFRSINLDETKITQYSLEKYQENLLSFFSIYHGNWTRT